MVNGCVHSRHTDRGIAEQTRAKLIAEHAQTELFAAEQVERAKRASRYPGHPANYQAPERTQEREGHER